MCMCACLGRVDVYTQKNNVHVHARTLNTNANSLGVVKATVYVISITTDGQHCCNAKKYSPSPREDGIVMLPGVEKLYSLHPVEMSQFNIDISFKESTARVKLGWTPQDPGVLNIGSVGRTIGPPSGTFTTEV